MRYRYYTDPFLAVLDAEVLAVKPAGDNYHVVLSDTIFYPTGGGQPHDTGWINDAEVQDVFAAEDSIIHVVDRPLPIGTARLRLNWERRFYHMQHHTGQHLLSAVFASAYGWATEGFHLGENYTTVDIAVPQISEEVIGEVEERANQLIYQDLPVKDYIVEPAQAAALPLRKAPSVESDIRIVEIAGFDYSPCGGTHLRSTGQIGLLKIIKTEKYKGMTRVYFLCGQRAFADYAAKHRLVQALSSSLSTAAADLESKVKAELELRRSLEEQVRELRDQLFAYQAKELTAVSSGRFIYHILEQGSAEDAQTLARHVIALGHYFVAVEAGSRVVLAQSLGTEPHCGKLVQTHAVPLGGKGGGSPQLAQVFFNDHDNLRKFRLFLQEYSQAISNYFELS